MAYISQDIKKAMQPKIKAVCQKYGVKATLSIENYSSITCTIQSGKLPNPLEHDGYTTVAKGRIDKDYTGERKDLLNEINTVLHGDWRYDDSDAMTDYFDTARYTHIQIWKRDKPYKQL